MPVSLRDAVRKRILVDSLKSVQSPGIWKVLVVEEPALRVLNSVCDVHDLSDVNVPVTETLSRKRTPYPDKEAIYFLMPSKEAVRAFVADFSGPKPMYSAAYIFCVSALPDALFDMIKQSPARKFIQALKELNIDFTPFESQVYHFNEPRALSRLYRATEEAHVSTYLDRTAEKMKSLFWTLEDCPKIRFFDPTGKRNSLSAHMAYKLQGALDHLKEMDPEWPPESPYAQTQLIVLDRSIDLFAPLMHTLTYQAAAHDLLQVAGTKVTYTKENTDTPTTQTAVIDESDPLFSKIRHLFVADAWEKILDTKSKLDDSTSSSADSVDVLKKIEQLKAKLYALPDAQKTLEKVVLHIHLYGEIMQAVKDRRLDEIAAAEQTIATGEAPGESGEPVNMEQVHSEIIAILENLSVPPLDKARLILTYIASVPNLDAEMLVETAQLKREAIAVVGLSILQKLREDELLLARRYTDAVRKAEQHKKQKQKGSTDNHPQPFDIHRYVPVLKHILHDVISNELNPVLFPTAGEEEVTSSPHPTAPSGLDPIPKARGGRGSVMTIPGFTPSWAKSKPPTGPDTAVDFRKNGSRIMVLFVDGLSFAEVRAAYEVTNEMQREVVIGAPYIFSPGEFVEALCEIGEKGPSVPVTLTPVGQGRRGAVNKPLPVPVSTTSSTPQSLLAPAIPPKSPSPTPLPKALPSPQHTSQPVPTSSAAKPAGSPSEPSSAVSSRHSLFHSRHSLSTSASSSSLLQQQQQQDLLARGARVKRSSVNLSSSPLSSSFPSASSSVPNISMMSNSHQQYMDPRPHRSSFSSPVAPQQQQQQQTTSPTTSNVPDVRVSNGSGPYSEATGAPPPPVRIQSDPGHMKAEQQEQQQLGVDANASSSRRRGDENYAVASVRTGHDRPASYAGPAAAAVPQPSSSIDAHVPPPRVKSRGAPLVRPPQIVPPPPVKGPRQQQQQQPEPVRRESQGQPVTNSGQLSREDEDMRLAMALSLQESRRASTQQQLYSSHGSSQLQAPSHPHPMRTSSPLYAQHASSTSSLLSTSSSSSSSPMMTTPHSSSPAPGVYRQGGGGATYRQRPREGGDPVSPPLMSPTLYPNQQQQQQGPTDRARSPYGYYQPSPSSSSSSSSGQQQAAMPRPQYRQAPAPYRYSPSPQHATSPPPAPHNSPVPILQPQQQHQQAGYFPPQQQQQHQPGRIGFERGSQAYSPQMYPAPQHLGGGGPPPPSSFSQSQQQQQQQQPPPGNQPYPSHPSHRQSQPPPPRPPPQFQNPYNYR
ncbi:Sec1-like protein [Phlyctochytrium arcticum]|nr:Sec1-like protein [Phlyctochytrium arcticum]